MGFRFRKSINVGGGFRINMSKSGIGYSWGFPGYRITKTANGRVRKTASIPRTGISYVSESSKQNSNAHNNVTNNLNETDNNYVEFQSSNIEQLQNVEYQTIINKISSALKINLAANIFLWITLAVFINPIFIFSGLVGIVLKIVSHRFCKTDLSYEFDEDTYNQYQNNVNAWMSLNMCKNIWQAVGKSDVSNRRTNAGAAHNISRTPVKISTKVPYFISTNAAVICIKLKKEKIYLLPDKLLVVKGTNIGVADYIHTSFDIDTVRFIEEVAPTDATIVSYTWQFVNNNGSPDKRYKNNRQLPVCLYGTIDIKSSECLDIQLMFSNIQIVQDFVGKHS